MWDGLLYFDTRCPCIRSAFISVSVSANYSGQEGYTADVYLDDFYGAEHPADSHFAFTRVQDLFDELGLSRPIITYEDDLPWDFGGHPEDAL